MSIIAGIGAVAKIDKKLADVQERVRRFTDRSGRSGRAHADAVAAWEARVREDNASGRDNNEPRPEPSISPDARVLALADLRAEQNTLQGARLRAIVDSREQIEAIARKRADKAVKSTQALLEKLRDALNDVRAAQIALDEARSAKRMLDPKQPRPSHPANLYGLMDLVEAVNNGRDPLDPFRASQVKPLGVQPGSTLGVQSNWTPKPSTSALAAEQTVTIRGLDGRPM